MNMTDGRTDGHCVTAKTALMLFEGVSGRVGMD